MRLSKLERAILLTLLRQGGYDIGYSYGEAQIGANGLTHSSAYHWSTEVCPCSYSSFSRAVRRLLYDKGLIVGLALAWVFVGKDYPDGDRPVQWQGRGKSPPGKDRRAKLKILQLDEEGYNVAVRLHDIERADRDADL